MKAGDIVLYEYKWIPNPYCGGEEQFFYKPSEMFNGKKFYIPFYTVQPIAGWRIKKLNK